MSEEQYMLSEKGMELALAILESAGLLPEPTESIDVDAVQLKAACVEYNKKSVAKGEKRSSTEIEEAIVVAYFEAYLEDLTRRIVN